MRWAMSDHAAALVGKLVMSSKVDGAVLIANALDGKSALHGSTAN
jgi:hypothetical protein